MLASTRHRGETVRRFYWPGDKRMRASLGKGEARGGVGARAEEKKPKRQERFLCPVVTPPKPKRCFVFDYESKDDASQRRGWTRPFLISFYDGTAVRFFRNSEKVAGLHWRTRHLLSGGVTNEFLEFIFGLFKDANEEDRKRFQSDKGLLYAHNGGKFDHLFLLGWLRRNRHMFVFEIASVQSRIQRLDVWPRGAEKEDGCWSFVDSISLLPMSLEKMGQAFSKGLFEKMKIDLDMHEDDPFWEWYCGQDAVVLYRGLEAFHKIVEDLGGEVGITAPSTAMNLFRRIYLKDEGWIERSAHFPDCDGTCKACTRRECEGECHGCLHDFVRLGYYGGRTEVFERRSLDKRLKYFDINSSYPASMMHPMPAGKAVFPKSTSLELFFEFRKSHIGFVECEVEIPKSCKIPPLPLRHGAKLIFPTGKIKGV